MLWYQGESDAISKDDADAYKGRLIKFFKDLRADLNHPGLRIIQVGLASGEGDFVEEVRKAQFGIKLPNVEIVDAKGLQLEPPEMLHLTTPSQVHLGQMLADKFLGLPSVFSIHTSAPSSSTTRACYSLVLFVCYFFVFLFLIVT